MANAVTKKMVYFALEIYANALLIGAEFSRSNIGSDFHCKMCNNVTLTETLEHLFRDCPVVQRLWMGSDLGINTTFGNTLDIQDWIANWLRLLKLKKRKG